MESHAKNFGKLYHLCYVSADVLCFFFSYCLIASFNHTRSHTSVNLLLSQINQPFSRKNSKSADFSLYIDVQQDFYH